MKPTQANERVYVVQFKDTNIITIHEELDLELRSHWKWSNDSPFAPLGAALWAFVSLIVVIVAASIALVSLRLAFSTQVIVKMAT